MREHIRRSSLPTGGEQSLASLLRNFGKCVFDDGQFPSNDGQFWFLMWHAARCLNADVLEELLNDQRVRNCVLASPDHALVENVVLPLLKAMLRGQTDKPTEEQEAQLREHMGRWEVSSSVLVVRKPPSLRCSGDPRTTKRWWFTNNQKQLWFWGGQNSLGAELRRDLKRCLGGSSLFESGWACTFGASPLPAISCHDVSHLLVVCPSIEGHAENKAINS